MASSWKKEGMVKSSRFSTAAHLRFKAIKLSYVLNWKDKKFLAPFMS
jgi:hypothetical protein